MASCIRPFSRCVATGAVRVARQPHVRSVQQASRRLCTVRASGDDLPKGTEDGKGEGTPEDPADKDLQLPAEIIKRMRDTVFGFDTFFVTKVEDYQADGVLFKGNLRGDPKVAFDKCKARLEKEVGPEYMLFLLEDQEGKPVVAVFPTSKVVPPEPAFPLVPASILFGLITLATTLNATGLPLLTALLAEENGIDIDIFDPIFTSAAAPGTLATIAILAVHEWGHWQAAQKEGAELAPPFFLPAGLGILGTFGAVTNIKSTLKDRAALLNIAAAGPAAGTALSMLLVIVGFGLTLSGTGGGPEVEAAAFNDCLLMGALGQAAFGSRLVTEPMIQLSPILLAGWAGLVINGLNCIPLGELDGGRIAFGIWGRKASTRINAVLTLLLGIAGIFDSLALYWVLLILLLQRGPILPQQEELSEPENVGLGLALLVLPVLTLIPYPIDLTSPGF